MITPIQFYKCLSDDIRLKSLLLIKLEQELCVCELMVALDENSQPKVSRHLAQLKKSNLLVDRKHKQWVYYSINPELPLWVSEVLSITTSENKPFLKDNLHKLAQMGDRPERLLSCCA